MKRRAVRWEELFDELMNEENEGERGVEEKETVELEFGKTSKDEVRKALEYREDQKELHCVFVELERACDGVPREELWVCMRESGVAEKYVRLVKDMNESSGLYE